MHMPKVFDMNQAMGSVRAEKSCTSPSMLVSLSWDQT